MEYCSCNFIHSFRLKCSLTMSCDLLLWHTLRTNVTRPLQKLADIHVTDKKTRVICTGHRWLSCNIISEISFVNRALKQKIVVSWWYQRLQSILCEIAPESTVRSNTGRPHRHFPQEWIHTVFLTVRLQLPTSFDKFCVLV